VVLPPTGSQPNSHGTERWRAAVDDATNAGAAIVAGLGSRQGSCNSPVPVAAGDDRGRHMQDGRGRLRGVHVEAPDNSSTAPGMAGTGDAEPAKRQLQQQRSRSSSVVTNSRSSQGRRGTCRSLSRGAGQTPAAAGSSRNCTGSCDMHAAVPAAGTHHGSGRASASELSLAGGGVRRSSGGGGRAREPAGPLELDPCAPPLNSIKLSQPVLADVDYIVHRWSHRWAHRGAGGLCGVQLHACGVQLHACGVQLHACGVQLLAWYIWDGQEVDATVVLPHHCRRAVADARIYEQT
jgi:hypothetical protein